MSNIWILSTYYYVCAAVAELPEVKDRSSVKEGVQMPVLSLQNEQNDFIPDELLSNLTSTICPQDRAQYNKTHKYTKVCSNNITVSVFHAHDKRPWICCFCINFTCSKEPLHLMLLFGAGLWNTCTRCSMAPQHWPQKIPLLSWPAHICDWSWQVDNYCQLKQYTVQLTESIAHFMSCSVV